MRLVFDNHEQGTPEWLAARCGKVTSSRAGCVKAQGKGSTEATTRRDYRIQLVTERLTGKPQEDGYVSRDMREGKKNEPFARMKYEVATGTTVIEVGFGRLASVMAGASLDGLVGDDGFIEIKCPKPATHLEYLMRGRLPPEHVDQVVHQFWITDRAWCDFVSFCPSMPKKLQLVVVRVLRVELQKEITEYMAAAGQLLAEVNTLEKQLLLKAA